MRTYFLLGLCLTLVGSACSSNTEMPANDAGVDAAPLTDAHISSDAEFDAPSSVDAGQDATVGADAGEDAFVQVDAGEDASVITDGGAVDCESQTTALAELLSIGGRACTVTVRLDYERFTVLGYQVFCNRYNTPSLAEAQATAESDTTYGADLTSLSGESPADDFVFYQSPGDFGGASVVSHDTGLTVFGGSIIWSGTGEINYPSSWRDAGELGSGCALSGGLGSTPRGWDLQSGDVLDVSDVNAALAVVAATAVPGAIWRGGYVFSSVVLLYPRTVGVLDPSTAEWIVIVNGGWLE
ncbi:MAG: hypothetical protein IPK60_05995 [Sandaracinaceae bacterium]|nr:hypothetical protein [Sandaracinaceae bacterium]